MSSLSTRGQWVAAHSWMIAGDSAAEATTTRESASSTCAGTECGLPSWLASLSSVRGSRTIRKRMSWAWKGLSAERWPRG